MRSLAPVRIPVLPAALAVGASVLLAACAAPKPRLDGPGKCYVVDSTDHVSRAAYDSMFRAAAPGDMWSMMEAALGQRDTIRFQKAEPFLPCDSTPAPRLRIRPLESKLPTRAASGWLLGANLAAAGAGAGLALGLQEGLYFLAPALTLPLAPMARASYRIEYEDTAGVRHEEVLKVRRGAWFDSRAESRREILDISTREISRRLFDREPVGEELRGPRNARSMRFSFEPLELIYAGRNDAVILATHVEKFLPGRFAFEFSPLFKAPLSGYEGSASVHFGPRFYALPGHWGPFVGLGPYGAVGYEENPYAVAGLPGVAGFVWQGWRFSLALEAGGGPVRRWGGPGTDFGWVALGGINVGAAF